MPAYYARFNNRLRPTNYICYFFISACLPCGTLWSIHRRDPLGLLSKIDLYLKSVWSSDCFLSLQSYCKLTVPLGMTIAHIRAYSKITVYWYDCVFCLSHVSRDNPMPDSVGEFNMRSPPKGFSKLRRNKPWPSLWIQLGLCPSNSLFSPLVALRRNIFILRMRAQDAYVPANISWKKKHFNFEHEGPRCLHF